MRDVDSSPQGAAMSALSPRTAMPNPQWCLHSFVPLLAVFVWIIEFKRRTNVENVAGGRRLIRQLMPEMLGLTLLATSIVLLLVSRNEHGLEDDVAWQDVKREWPMLMTADTLIGVQAMLRLVLLLSASLRRSHAIVSPLDGEPWAFFTVAGFVRVLLLALSPRDVYRLDGPLGGDLNIALEVTTFIMLLPFGVRILKKGCARIIVFLVVVLLLAGLAKYNHFALTDAGHSYLDGLFSLTMLLEMAAAPAFLLQTGQSGVMLGEGFTAFAYGILPVQQSFPTYFLLAAFAPPFHNEPSLVGSGRPFELLQTCGVAQVTLYVLAGCLYIFSSGGVKTVSIHAETIPASEAPPGEECAICLGSSDECSSLKPHWRKLRCGHHFHDQCIFEWLKKSKRCPVCRRHLDE